jgi:CBS domain-containing protein
MKCEELMKRDVECLSANDSAQMAAKKMRDANVGFLPICDEQRTVTGTVTDRDITIRLVADNLPSSTPIKQVMTREVVSCRPSDTLEVAQRTMAERQKSRLLVCDSHNRLLGVISLSDISQVADGAQATETLRSVAAREARS